MQTADFERAYRAFVAHDKPVRGELMTAHDVLYPAGWNRRGVLERLAASGRMLFLGGMIGWNGQQEFESDDFIDQVAQARATSLRVCRGRRRARAPGAADVGRDRS